MTNREKALEEALRKAKQFVDLLMLYAPNQKDPLHSCGPESQCDAFCAEISNVSDTMHDLNASVSYALSLPATSTETEKADKFLAGLQDFYDFADELLPKPKKYTQFDRGAFIENPDGDVYRAADVDAYLAALHPPAPSVKTAVSAWRSMEDAPKDGTSILGYAGGKQTVVSWFKEGGYWSLVEFGAYAEDSEWWPTAWMPLPPPPSSEKL